MTNKSKTIFCDLDGTLVKHSNPVVASNPQHKMEVLSGTHDKLREWDSKGYHIIITTGRKNSLRKTTEEQLKSAGIFYDQLIMGVGGGDRVVINDRKPNSKRDTAYAVNLNRNEGVVNAKI